MSRLSCLNHFRSASLTALLSGLRSRFILDLFRSNAHWIWILFLQIVWIVEFTRQNSRNTSALFFPFSVCRIALNFLGTFLFFTVPILLFCRSPVDCDSRKAEGNLTHRVNYRLDLRSSGYVVGPCHHGMARPQVADRGTASDKEGSCE